MIKSLIVSLSFAGLGLVAYLAITNIKHALAARGWERRINLAYATARLGFVIVVGLITEAVFNTTGDLPLNWRVILYTLGLCMTAFGYLGIAIEQRPKRREN